MAEVVAEGMLAWLVESVAHLIMDQARNRMTIPYGNETGVLQTKLTKLIRTDSRKLQDAIGEILCRCGELEEAGLKIRKAFNYLDQSISGKPGSFSTADRVLEAGPIEGDAKECFKEALSIAERVHAQTIDPEVKVDALRSRLFLTYILEAYNPSNTVHTFIKLLTAPIVESLDVKIDHSGLAGTLKQVGLYRKAKKVARVQKLEDRLVDMVSKIVRNTLNQIHKYISHREYKLTESDIELINNTFLGPERFTPDEVSALWGWRAFVETQNYKPGIFSFFDKELISKTKELFKTGNNIGIKDPVIEFTALVPYEEKVGEYGHMFAIGNFSSSPDSLPLGYFVSFLERVPLLPQILGIKWVTACREKDDKWPFANCAFFCPETGEIFICLKNQLRKIDMGSPTKEAELAEALPATFVHFASFEDDIYGISTTEPSPKPQRRKIFGRRKASPSPSPPVDVGAGNSSNFKLWHRGENADLSISWKESLIDLGGIAKSNLCVFHHGDFLWTAIIQSKSEIKLIPIFSNSQGTLPEPVIITSEKMGIGTEEFHPTNLANFPNLNGIVISLHNNRIFLLGTDIIAGSTETLSKEIMLKPLIKEDDFECMRISAISPSGGELALLTRIDGNGLMFVNI